MSRIPSVQRNGGKGVGCCLTQRKLRHVKQQPRASAKKREDMRAREWTLENSGESSKQEKVVSLYKLPNPHQWIKHEADSHLNYLIDLLIKTKHKRKSAPFEEPLNLKLLMRANLTLLITIQCFLCVYQLQLINCIKNTHFCVFCWAFVLSLLFAALVQQLHGSLTNLVGNRLLLGGQLQFSETNYAQIIKMQMERYVHKEAFFFQHYMYNLKAKWADICPLWAHLWLMQFLHAWLWQDTKTSPVHIRHPGLFPLFFRLQFLFRSPAWCQHSWCWANN